MGCFKPLPKAKAYILRKLWDQPQRKVVALGGRIVNTRGLGFEEPDDEACLSTSSKGHGCYSCFSTSECDIEEALKKDPTIIEVKNAPKELEEGGQSTVDDLVEINLGSDEDPRPTYISASLAEEERVRLKSLLLSFLHGIIKKCRAGLDPKVAVPKLKIKEDATPVKQAPRRMRVELEEQVTAETRKLIDAGKRKMLFNSNEGNGTRLISSQTFPFS